MVKRLLTPEGSFTQCSQVANMVADTAKFQEVVGAGGYATALESVYEFESMEGQGECPPCAIVFPSKLGIHSIARTVFRPSGTVMLAFEITTPLEYRAESRTNQSIWFMNTVGKIVSQMACLSGQPGNEQEPVPGQTHIEIGSVSQVEGPDIILPGQKRLGDPDKGESVDSFWWIVLEVEVL